MVIQTQYTTRNILCNNWYIIENLKKFHIQWAPNLYYILIFDWENRKKRFWDQNALIWYFYLVPTKPFWWVLCIVAKNSKFSTKQALSLDQIPVFELVIAKNKLLTKMAKTFDWKNSKNTFWLHVLLKNRKTIAIFLTGHAASILIYSYQCTSQNKQVQGSQAKKRSTVRTAYKSKKEYSFFITERKYDSG